MKEQQAKVPVKEDLLTKRYENSKKLLDRLMALSKPPTYADSLFASSLYNKTRVLEA